MSYIIFNIDGNILNCTYFRRNQLKRQEKCNFGRDFFRNTKIVEPGKVPQYSSCFVERKAFICH